MLTDIKDVVFVRSGSGNNLRVRARETDSDLIKPFGEVIFIQKFSDSVLITTIDKILFTPLSSVSKSIGDLLENHVYLSGQELFNKLISTSKN